MMSKLPERRIEKASSRLVGGGGAEEEETGPLPATLPSRVLAQGRSEKGFSRRSSAFSQVVFSFIPGCRPPGASGW